MDFGMGVNKKGDGPDAWSNRDFSLFWNDPLTKIIRNCEDLAVREDSIWKERGMNRRGEKKMWKVCSKRKTDLFKEVNLFLYKIIE